MAACRTWCLVESDYNEMLQSTHAVLTCLKQTAFLSVHSTCLQVDTPSAVELWPEICSPVTSTSHTLTPNHHLVCMARLTKKNAQPTHTPTHTGKCRLASLGCCKIMTVVCVDSDSGGKQLQTHTRKGRL